MVRKQFNLNEKEYKEFTNKVMIKSKTGIVFFTGLIVLLGAYFLSMKEGVKTALITAVILFFSYLIIVGLGMFFIAPLFSNRAYKKHNIANYKFDYEILDTGIKQNKTMYLYDEFIKAKETDLLFYLYYTKKEIVVIPKRLLDEKEYEHVKKIFQAKIKKTNFKKTNKNML